MAEQEYGGSGQGDSDEGEPDILNTWQRGSVKHPTLQSVTGPPFTWSPLTGLTARD
jgi:hypothetical protein